LSDRGTFRPFRHGVVGLLGVLFVSTLAFGAVTATPVPTHGSAPATGSGCPGTSIPTAYSGNVTVVGGPLPASFASGVNLSYNYSVTVEISNRSSGALLSTSCDADQGTASSDANGSFEFDLALPATHCYGDECTHDLGPYGPVGLGLAGPTPAGYELLTTSSGSSLSLRIVAELGELALDPDASARTLSTNAPGTFLAEAMNAAGAPSPLAPKFRWNLTGTGWSFEGSGRGANVTVEALAGAGLAELSVSASAEVGPNHFSVGPLEVDLEALSTAFAGGDATPTNLDAGGSVSFMVDGSGAPGYTYSANVAPGLGLPPVDWPCTTTAATGGGVSVACAGSVTYPTAGVADPTVELTNAYSTAEGSLPSVTVAPLPAIALTPQSPVGYTGTPVPIRVSAVPGSGTPPYTQACLDTGVGAPACSDAPGPNWTFSPVYSTPGQYSGLAWVVDSGGTNRSQEVLITIVAPISLSSMDLPRPIRADAPVALSATVVGGDLPVQYWWNVSGDATSVATGHLSADGYLNATWVPSAPGSTVITLTVVDALGTVEQTTALANVGTAVANTLAEVTVPGAGPAVAGSAVPLAWQAEDLQGASVPGFNVSGAITIAGPDGLTPVGVYVNATGAGPLAPSMPGSFTVPSTAWEQGRLSLTFTSNRAGSFELALSGPGLLGRTGPLEATFVADLGHLRFSEPSVAIPGARVNDTLWRVSDEYGNPAPGATVDVDYWSGGTASETVESVVSLGAGATGAWVNFTAPTAAGGSREVTDAAGTVLLGPIAVPPAPLAAPGLSTPELTLATAAPLGAVGVGLTVWAQRRRRDESVEGGTMDEDDLRRWVEGRDRVIGLLRESRVLDLAGLEGAWGTVPAPPELADWVASLVADGSLGARTGPDGVARFCLVASADGPPIVLLDDAALDRAAAARRAITEEPDPRDGDVGTVP
jgi:hypothetical protein